MSAELPPRSLSVRGLAKRWAVAPAKVRALIRRGVVQAIDVGMLERSQLRITPEAIQDAERSMAVRKPTPRRKRQEIDPAIAKLLEG